MQEYKSSQGQSDVMVTGTTVGNLSIQRQELGPFLLIIIMTYQFRFEKQIKIPFFIISLLNYFRLNFSLYILNKILVNLEVVGLGRDNPRLLSLGSPPLAECHTGTHEDF